MRRAQNADTHALKQHRLSQNNSPVFRFCTSYRVWPATRAWKRNTLLFTQLKIFRYEQHFFSLFLDKLLWIDIRPIYCGITTAGHNGIPNVISPWEVTSPLPRLPFLDLKAVLREVSGFTAQSCGLYSLVKQYRNNQRHFQTKDQNKQISD